MPGLTLALPALNFSFLPLRRTCKQAASLLIAREDRALALPDRLALKFHLMACNACPKFEQQVLTLRAAMGQWRGDAGTLNSQATDTAPSDTSPPLA